MILWHFWRVGAGLQAGRGATGEMREATIVNLWSWRSYPSRPDTTSFAGKGDCFHIVASADDLDGSMRHAA